MSHLRLLRPLTRLLPRPQHPHNHHQHLLPTLTTANTTPKHQTRTLRSATATSATATTTTTTTTIPPNEAYPSQTHPSHPELTQAETQLTTHPLLLTLRQDKSYTETRPHLSMIPTHRASHFVAGTLSGAHKVTVPPYVFTRTKPVAQPQQTQTQNQAPQTPPPQDQPTLAQTISLFHLGTTLNGHPGYVHGGLLSVMFDETFARCVAASFPSGVGMTANLSVDFRKPARPDRVYVLRAETVRVEGRKAWVEGSLTALPPRSGSGDQQGQHGQHGQHGEEEEGTMVAEARALFVEPKFAESMVPLYRN